MPSPSQSSRTLPSQEIEVFAPPSSSTIVGTLASASCPDGAVYLLTIRLSTAKLSSSKPPSPNVYWVRKAPPPTVTDGLLLLPRERAQDEFLPLSKLRTSKPLVMLAGSAVGRRSSRVLAWRPADASNRIDISSGKTGGNGEDEEEWEVEVNITNTSGGGDTKPAVLVRVSIVRLDHSDVLPCFVTENFFTLTAGDSINSTLSFRWTASSPPGPSGPPPPVCVTVSGWNVAVQSIDIDWSAVA